MAAAYACQALARSSVYVAPNGVFLSSFYALEEEEKDKFPQLVRVSVVVSFWVSAQSQLLAEAAGDTYKPRACCHLCSEHRLLRVCFVRVCV